MPIQYALVVDGIIDDTGSIIGYMSKGHHSTDDFIDDLRGEWDQDVLPEDVKQGYWRVLPPDAEGFKSYQESQPGPGAFPVTYIYTGAR
jgi:hypothetical protein